MLRHAQKKPAGSAAEAEAHFGCARRSHMRAAAPAHGSARIQDEMKVKTAKERQRHPGAAGGTSLRASRVWVTGARSQGGRCPAERLVMVGDRFLTDVVFSNRNGLLSVRVAPLELRGEPAAVALVSAPQLRFATAGRLSLRDALNL